MSLTFQSYFEFESCIYNLPSSVNSKRWGLPWGRPLDTHPALSMLKRALVQCFTALFLSYFEMFSSRKKRQLCVFGLALNSNSSVKHNITNEAGQLFPNYSICIYSIHVIKLGFHYLKRSAVSLPPPAVNSKCCSQNSTCHILFLRTGRILRYTGFFPWLHFNMYFV